ncbi:MAG: hypothetical protein JNK05_12225 [Myxococcales bacterium]|nr:hypothetical protein [Myxococcales bacterium]
MSDPRWIHAIAIVAIVAIGGCVRWESKEIDPVCWGLYCADCIAQDQCVWDTSQRVCRNNGSNVPTPAMLREVSACRGDLRSRDASVDSALTDSMTSTADASIDSSQADAGAAPQAKIRVASTLSDGTAFDLCARGPSSSRDVVVASGVRYGFRTGDLAVGPPGTYTLFVARAGSSCDRAAALLRAFNVELSADVPQWFVAYRASTGTVLRQFSVTPSPRDGRLRLRWLLARAAGGPTTFEYMAAGTTVTWSAVGPGDFGANADTSMSDWMTVLPEGAPASVARATVMDAPVATSRPLPSANESYTIVLAEPLEGTPGDGAFLLLPEERSSAATAAVSALW